MRSLHKRSFFVALFCLVLTLSVLIINWQRTNKSWKCLCSNLSESGYKYDINTERPPDEFSFSASVISKRHRFSYDDDDVILHLHIPKTGGSHFDMSLRSFGKNNPDLKPGWFFSWSTVGWACGFHAGYYDYQKCDKESPLRERQNRTKQGKQFNFHYVSMLREPDQRVISEHGYTSRLGEWFRENLHCNHYIDDMMPTVTKNNRTNRRHPQCLIKGVLHSYRDLPLDYFLSCENSYTTNRQVTMLANLSSTAGGCPPFGPPQLQTAHPDNRLRWEKLLRSAKENLQKLSYFGLQEEQVLSMELFEWTFEYQLTFTNYIFAQKETQSSKRNISDALLIKVKYVTTYEWEFYNYAKSLFYERVHFMHADKNAEASLR